MEEQIKDIKRTCNLENPESYAYKNKAVAKLSINALSVIRQLQEENRKLKEWLPISTAPKDGTEIIVKTTDIEFEFDGEPCPSVLERAPVLQVVWGEKNVYSSSRKAWMLMWCDQDGEYNSYPYITNITHWLPLPTKPESNDK